ncbi:MAG TPA: TIGR01777 family oxidoreductase, partial [Mycobacteriales bacterium]|nr:TIGR01777 family oxidoreductase [Mycobacteriales bacterium]
DSRVAGTLAVARAVAAAGTPVLLSASAIGLYGDTGDRLTDETGPVGKGFLASLCRDWEAATAPAADAGTRVVHLRTGIVLAGHGGALQVQVRLAKVGLLAPLGAGDQWVSWISLPDEAAAIRHLLTAEVRGPVNLVSPAPVTNRDFTKALNALLHRPTPPVGVPRLALRAALGEFADDALKGQRLVPAVLQGSGFGFMHPELTPALQSALRRS